MADPSEEVLSIWTVYDHPSDDPEFFVARRHVVLSGGTEPTDDILRSKELAILRYSLRHRGLTCIPRDPNDHPNIVESWL